MSSIVVIKKLLGLLFILAYISCSKEGGTPAPGEGTSTPKYVELKILEEKTNLPIEGATVALQKCIKYDIEFGCTSYSSGYLYSTSATGTCSFPASLTVDRINVSHPKYWSASSTHRGNISMCPEAWTKVDLRKVNNYPPGYGVRVELTNYSPFGPFNSITFPATIDTIVYIRSRGLSQNAISWSISDNPWNIGSGLGTGGTTTSFYINKFDTASVNINY